MKDTSLTNLSILCSHSNFKEVKSRGLKRHTPKLINKISWQCVIVPIKFLRRECKTLRSSSTLKRVCLTMKLTLASLKSCLSNSYNYNEAKSN